MPLQQGFEFPPDEELNVQEVNISLPYLKAGAMHFHKQCEDVNNEFMLCKQETDDPRQCLREGRDVTNCALDFFRKIKKNCREEFELHAKCLYMSSGEWDYKDCRRSQKAYDDCMLDKLNIPRAFFAEPLEIKIHHAKRPKPVEPPVHYPDAPQECEAVSSPKDYGEPRFKIRHYLWD